MNCIQFYVYASLHLQFAVLLIDTHSIPERNTILRDVYTGQEIIYYAS